MTSNNNSVSEICDAVPTAPAEKFPAAKSLSSARPLATQQYLYFTETNTDRILDNLDGLRDMCSRACPSRKVMAMRAMSRNFRRCA